MTARTTTAPRPARGSLWRAAGIALAGSIIINELLRFLSVLIIRPDPGFLPLTAIGPVIMFTAIGVLGATLAYWAIGRFSPRGDQIFTAVAVVVLILSFIPNIMTGLNPQSAPFPGVTWAAIIVLMLMHLPPAILSVLMLTRR